MTTKLTRRQFALGCSAGIAAMAGGRLGGLVFADPQRRQQGGAKDPILLVVFLRGGMDGLNFCAPVDDTDYMAARAGDLRIHDRGDLAGLALDRGLGGDFRLHHSAGPLHELYQAGRLAIVHAAGLPNGTRSHFDAMDLMERGSVDNKSLATGWLSRHLATQRPSGLLPVIAAGSSTPGSLLGSGEAVSMWDPEGFGIATHWQEPAEASEILRGFYAGGDSPLHGAARRTLDAVRVVQRGVPRDGDGIAVPYEPENGASYPDDYTWHQSLVTVARLIKMDVGLTLATLDFGGWDTHEGQAYRFPQQVDTLARGLGALYNDLSRYHDRLSIVVMSEFGRRLKSNESGGTDHGHGNLMMLLGQQVNGGRMFGQWPGLATEQLDDRADLAITTDYRQVLAELLVRGLGNAQLGRVLPGLGSYQPLGVLKGTDLPIDWSEDKPALPTPTPRPASTGKVLLPYLGR